MKKFIYLFSIFLVTTSIYSQDNNEAELRKELKEIRQTSEKKGLELKTLRKKAFSRWYSFSANSSSSDISYINSKIIELQSVIDYALSFKSSHDQTCKEFDLIDVEYDRIMVELFGDKRGVSDSCKNYYKTLEVLNSKLADLKNQKKRLSSSNSSTAPYSTTNTSSNSTSNITNENKISITSRYNNNSPYSNSNTNNTPGQSSSDFKKNDTQTAYQNQKREYERQQKERYENEKRQRQLNEERYRREKEAYEQIGTEIGNAINGIIGSFKNKKRRKYTTTFDLQTELKKVEEARDKFDEAASRFKNEISEIIQSRKDFFATSETITPTHTIKADANKPIYFLVAYTKKAYDRKVEKIDYEYMSQIVIEYDMKATVYFSPIFIVYPTSSGTYPFVKEVFADIIEKTPIFEEAQDIHYYNWFSSEEELLKQLKSEANKIEDQHNFKKAVISTDPIYIDFNQPSQKTKSYWD